MPGEQTLEAGPQPSTRGTRRLVTDLAVTGMTCGNCARHVTLAIQGVRGVRSATVNLEANRATVRWEADTEPAIEAVIKAVRAEGFDARVAGADRADRAALTLAGWRLNLWLGVPVTIFLMLGEWVFGLGGERWFHWAAFGLAGVVQVLAGARFYRGAWSQLKVGSSNMDTLVALGSTSAFGFSAWALLTGYGGHVYFTEAAAIITLISVGHWLESRVSLKASSALRGLMNLAPAMARRRNGDGTETEVPVAELRLGDRVTLRPGDQVPTDGTVQEGGSAVDESMLTGESSPVEKSEGVGLCAGTVNLNGRLVMRVTATGEDTALAQIIAAVQRAQASRAHIQRLGDRVSSVFVPVVVAVALAAGLWWSLAPASAYAVHEWLGLRWLGHPPEVSLAAGFIIASAVLIVACPCAMGLATPAAIMAGANTAAQRGILIRDAVALEKAGQIRAVVFDKTGTLTAGKPRVVKVWSGATRAREGSASDTEPTVRRLGVGLAQHSAHPISRAIARLPDDRQEVLGWQEIRGAGVQGTFEGETARLGSTGWLREAGVDLKPADTFIEEWSAQGATLVGLALGQRLTGMFAVQDTLKPGAGEVVARLRHEGLKTYLVTGDNPLTAASIARQAGIPPDNVFAEVRPERKADFVKQLQAKGERVAFVGDGINDAPALEQADLGIAVCHASDIAREAADILLLKSEIEAVPESLGLARATLRTIRQNLFWAFFYNSVGIPLAALGFMSPILCAAAMGVSDLVVIGNALRLRRWRLK